MSDENRIALVVGNAEYKYAAPLHNPLYDAFKMGEALERLNFKVKVATNCSINDFQRELRVFLERLAGADAALFYYSGHALQYDNDNHLVPVDARLEVPEDLERLAYRLAPRLETMRRRARVSLVFLDACRDDPFKLGQTGQTTSTKRVIVRQLGLKEVPETELRDALIAFAAEQGHTAEEGKEGELSPFTEALLQHLETPGLEVTEMMRLVKKSVIGASPLNKIATTPPSNFDTLLRNPFAFKGAICNRLTRKPLTTLACVTTPGPTIQTFSRCFCTHFRVF